MSIHSVYFCGEMKKCQHFLIVKKCLIWSNAVYVDLDQTIDVKDDSEM